MDNRDWWFHSYPNMESIEMTKEQFLQMAYKTQGILVHLIKTRYMLNNTDEDTAIIRSEIDEAIKDLACAAENLTEIGLFGKGDYAPDTDAGGKEEEK